MKIMILTRSEAATYLSCHIDGEVVVGLMPGTQATEAN